MKKELGGNVEEVAKVVVTGTIDTAGSIGNSAIRTVKEMMVGVVEGVKDVAGSALPKPGTVHTKSEQEPSSS